MVVPCIVKIWLYWFGGEHGAVRAPELEADQQRLDAADHEEQQAP